MSSILKTLKAHHDFIVAQTHSQIAKVRGGRPLPIKGLQACAEYIVRFFYHLNIRVGLSRRHYIGFKIM